MPLDQIWLRTQSSIPEHVPVDDVLRRLAWMHEVERDAPVRDSWPYQNVNVTAVPGAVQQNLEAFAGLYNVVGSGNVSIAYSADNTSAVATGGPTVTVGSAGGIAAGLITGQFSSDVAYFSGHGNDLSNALTLNMSSGTTLLVSSCIIQESTNPRVIFVSAGDFTAGGTTNSNINLTYETLSTPSQSSDAETQAEAIFQTLYKRWMEEVGFSSSSTDIVLSSAYQRIIGMGQSALPLIFAQLRIEGPKPDQWFWALEAITRENPVPREFWTNRRLVARYWLDWADAHGYAP